MSPCDTFIGDAIYEEVRGPIRYRISEDIGKIVTPQVIKNCHLDVNGTIEYDLRYITTHSWTVGAGYTSGIEGSIESGLLIKAIARGSVGISAQGRVEGERSRQQSYEHGVKLAVDFTPCLSAKAMNIFHDYDAIYEQDVGDIFQSVIPHDDGTVELSDPCFYATATYSATGDGDIGHEFKVVRGIPCDTPDCDGVKAPNGPDEDVSWDDSLGGEFDPFLTTMLLRMAVAFGIGPIDGEVAPTDEG